MALLSPESQEVGPVSIRALRVKLARALKFAAVSRKLDRAKAGNHALRARGEAIMSSVGFELYVIELWERCVSTTFHNYQWRDDYILYHVGRGMVAQSPAPGQCGQHPTWREGRKTSRPTEQDSRRRLVEISNTTSGALRHWRLEGMDDEAWAPIKNVCNIKRLMGDLYGYGRYSSNSQRRWGGGGGGAKFLFELSRWGRCIRCSNGHSGVRPEIRPVANDL